MIITMYYILAFGGQHWYYVKLRASCVLCKSSTTGLCPQPSTDYFCFAFLNFKTKKSISIYALGYRFILMYMLKSPLSKNLPEIVLTSQFAHHHNLLAIFVKIYKVLSENLPGPSLTGITLHGLEDVPNVFVSFPIPIIKHHD